MPRANRATIKTIAKEANVTANTVSLTLRNSNLVKPETKKLILEIAKRQGYVPNVLAESLRSGRSHFIALIFGDLANPLFAMKTRNMERELHKRGYQVMILSTGEELDRELAAIHTAISRKVDGVVLCPCQRGQRGLDLLRQNHVPCVLVGRNFEDALEDSVVWDNVRGAYLATSHLIGLGCRRILHICGNDALSTAHERMSGYVMALTEAGLPVEPELIVAPNHGMVAEALASIEKPFDGLFAFSDMLAWEAARALPPGMPIIGFDDIQSFMALPFNMPSIAADLMEETQQVVNLLLERIEMPERPTQKCVLPVKLVVR